MSLRLRALGLCLAAPAALVGCGVSPGPNGAYALGDTTVYVEAGELGDGCRLTGGPYPAEDLEPDDAWLGDPNVAACDAWVSWQGPRAVVVADTDGQTHPAYRHLELQPLFVSNERVYFHMQAVQKPGGFRMPLVLGDRRDPTTWEVVHLSVTAIDPEG